MTPLPSGPDTPVLETARLSLRCWQPADRAPLAAMNADPRVMAFLPTVLTEAESDAQLDRLRAHILEHGFGYWALERRADAALIGFCGLRQTVFDAAFTPCVDIGWRLAFLAWGQGYATEAARAALAYGFETLGLAEILSFTVPMNVRSRAVMERLGMRYDPAGDFDHPQLQPGHPLRRHVLYRLAAPPARDT